jgi:thiol-disulfide isomerase/thioredoxin
MTPEYNCKYIDNDTDLQNALKVNEQVIALIYASWCPFCIRFLPVFQRWAKEGQGLFLAVKDDREIIAEKYSIDVFPTVLSFKNAALSNRLDGIPGIGLNEQQLSTFRNQHPDLGPADPTK